MKLYLDLNDLKNQNWLTKKSEYNQFGGNGENTPPKVRWDNVHQDTKSFALTLYDPDAPTGSGFWHWIVVNIPSNLRELSLDESSLYGNIINDFGNIGYGGVCPPEGDKPHQYIFTIHSINVDNLEINKDMSNAIVRFLINAHTIDKSSFITYYQR